MTEEEQIKQAKNKIKELKKQIKEIQNDVRNLEMWKENKQRIKHLF